MRQSNLKKRGLAAVMAAMLLLLATLTAALAVTYPYKATSMSNVNMRRKADSRSTILKRIKMGDIVTIQAKSGDYYEVEFDGAEGYVQCRYIDGTDPSPDPSPDPSMHMNAPLLVSAYPYDTTTAGYVKLRKTASETGEVIRTLPAGTLVTVTGMSKSFAKVQHEGTTGYLYAGYVNLASISLAASSAASVDVVSDKAVSIADTAVAPDALKYTSVQKGDSGTVVTALQQVLVELDYLDGKVDGKFGTKTEDALKIFQKRNGLKQTGIADQELQYLIYEGTPKDYRGYRQYVTVVAPVTGAVIKQKATGEAVIRVQTQLKQLGYYTGELSGVCDDATVAAISAFEARNGLISDGLLNAADQTVLFGTSAIDINVVVTPSPSPTPQAPKGTVRPDDKGDDVKLVQTRLIELGYYVGKATGTFDADSVTALKKFQKANALGADGVCGIQTRAVLFAPHPVYAVATATPVPLPTFTPTPGLTTVSPSYEPLTPDNVVTVKAGSTGEAVLRVQTRLQALGYYTSRLDGIFLTDDINAVRAFQKANSLTVDGKAGYNTQTVLYSDAAVTGNNPITTTPTLRYGSQGTEVLTLQNRLITLGYLTQTADGKFGVATKTAVIAFQKANNLTSDGIVGSTTLEALNSAKAEDNKVPYVLLYQGAVNDAVKDMQNRLIALGYLTGKADGVFGVNTSLALIAFQKANGLTADGVLGTQTTKKLNSTSVVLAGNTQVTTTVPTAPSVTAGTVSAANVRYANWYTEIRAKVRTYPNVTVYDFTTGISWQLNIFSNGAHSDAEPLTAEDTASMNRAFGGKTTWTPKAVWVVLSDGTVYMASTHNTPHSPSHISTNNFNGHLCVHFPRTQSQVESIGPYATSHQKAIDLGWEATQKRAGQ